MLKLRSTGVKRTSNGHRALTLVEVLVTITIFVILAWMMMVMVQEITKGWTKAERQRVLYERAAGALDRVADDLSMALCREPTGTTDVRVRLLGDLDAQTGMQRVMFVRSFEAGPERALTFFAGDGRPNTLRFRPPEEEDAPRNAPTPVAYTPPDRDTFTGKFAGDYRALGGMAQVAYFVEKQTLYRAIRAPVSDQFADLLNTHAATPLVGDVLYLAFDYWGQSTSQWEQPGKGSNVRGAERIWDSTRGIAAAPLGQFFLHRGRESLTDPEDDVFPMKIRVTITVDSPLPRCTHTKLAEASSSSDGMLFVNSTQGFPEGGTENSYILVGNEWIHYTSKTADAFKASRRGARGSSAVDHPADELVRIGQTFRRVIFIPGFRVDWTSDEHWRERRLQAGKK